MHLAQSPIISDPTEMYDVLREANIKIGIFGSPGSGKGEQGKIFKRNKIPGIITSDELIALANELDRDHPARAEAIREAMSTGSFALDGEVTSMMRDIVKKMSGTFFVDGFPRNEEQV